MKSKRVLITGMAGLLGSYFSRYLLEKGYNVIGIDDFSGGYVENLPEGVFCSNIDLTDFNAVKVFFVKHKPEYVYHFAAYAAEGLSPFIRTFNYQANVIASANLITASINNDVNKFIFTSSNGVYGEDNVPPFKETLVPKPIDPYGIAKYAIEMDLQAAYKQFGLRYSIVRPHNVVGMYQNIWDKYRNVIGIWIRQTLDNEPITVYGDGEQIRAFSDMKFLNEPLEKLMYGFDSEIFNLGSDKEITLKEAACLVKKVAQSYGYNPEIVHLEPRVEAKYAYAEHTKAKELLGFDDKTDLEETIKQMFAWALTQPKRVVKYLSYETEKNIYGYWK